MKKLAIFTLILGLISLLFAGDMIIHRTNGQQTVIPLDEISGISFAAGQTPILYLSTVPMHINWNDDNNPPDDQSVLMTVRVMDAEDNPMLDISIVFTGTLGEPENGDYTEITDADGYIYKSWQFHEYECPPAMNGIPGQSTATLTVQILNTTTDIHATIILRRYEGDI